jgi:uncharacterized membrane protein YfcA
MPLLSLVLPIGVAAPLVALVSTTVSIIVLARDWRGVHARTAAWLVASSLCGIPLGLLLLKTAEERVVKGLLAVVVLTFSLFCLFHPRQLALRTDRSAWLFGLAAGILGGAYNTNGPPLVVYGTLRGWTAEDFRTTLQGYFLPTGLFVLCAHGLAGLWVPAVLGYFAASLPLVVIAVVAGRAINRRLHGRQFVRAVHAILIALGTMLLIQSMRG